ncbi:MAG TPA: GNVR domain-containing protein [Acidobacteriaceae bacterium]|nr:GNVR domain-containing protein [Acidobacteriaceae bacterium]
MLGHRKLDANDYVAILKRRRKLIAIPVVLLPLIAYGVTYLIPARYVSQALILIEGQRVSSEIAPSIVTQSLDSRLNSMSQQVLSRSQIQPIVLKYNLLPSKRLSMDDRVVLVRNAIGIKPIKPEVQRTGGLPGFFITFTASDAPTAQKVCADISSLFLTESLRNRQDAAEDTTTFLKQQVDDAKRDLDEHDAKLAAFQQKYVGKLPGQEVQNGTMLTSLNTQLSVQNQDLARLEQQKDMQQSMLAQELQQQQSTPATTVPGPNGAVTPLQFDYQQLAALQAKEAQLTSRYTPDYPDVVAIRRDITDLKAKIAKEPQQQAAAPAGPASAPRPSDSLGVIQLRAQVRGADILIQAKKKELEQTQATVALYQNRIESSPLVEEQFKDLNRDYDTAQKNYDDLLVKMNHAKMARDLESAQQGEQFRLMDEANLPEDPTFPNRQLFAAGGLFLGLAIGLALAAFLEYKDTALRTEQDVWAFTQLPTLAVIAYSGNVEVRHKKPGLFARFKAMFQRKTPPEMLSKAEG